jgi:hypothetical protein
MTEGFIMDEAHGRWRVSRWQSGRPVKSIWTGIKQSRANQLPVSSWRCDRCGFLESYATAG